MAAGTKWPLQSWVNVKRRRVAGKFVSREDAACYRLYAANCVEIAQNVGETERRLFLFKMAQAWGRLADQVERFDGRTYPKSEELIRHHPNQR